MEDIFKPNPDKLRFSIQIDVYENCATTTFKGKDQKVLDKINFHNVIGVLEAQKQHIIWHQRESNLAKKMKPKSRAAKKNGA